MLVVLMPDDPTRVAPASTAFARRCAGSFELSERHGFVIASDKCDSEIWFGEQPPLGGLEVAAQLGLGDFKWLIAFTSLSKRSNLPGLRSGFVAGDAELIKAFLLYRPYQGGAMVPTVQRASEAAWNDEAHVANDRTLYREEFARVTPLLAAVLDVRLPDAGFYLFAGVQGSDALRDQRFARELLAQYNVTVLPGSFLARESQGVTPGDGRIRLALVASVEECIESTKRIAALTRSI